MRTAAKILAWIGIGVLGLITLALIAVAMLTNTNWGRSKVRTIALDQLRNAVHGEVQLGEISGNLLHGITFDDLVITDSAGQPFLAIARARAQWDLGALLRKKIILTSLALENPTVVLDRPPGGEWNWKRIFPTSAGPTDTTFHFGSWIELNNVRLTSGRLVVRTPWHPSDTLHAAVRDSLVRVALSGQSRAHIERVPDGFQSVMDFREMMAGLPYIRLAMPDSDKVFDLASMQMDAFPFRPPAAEIRAGRGTFRMDADSLWFDDIALELPDTRLSGGGAYQLGPGSVALRLRAPQVALGDLRWLYPQLPAGSGEMDFTLAYRPDSTSDYVAKHARLVLADGGSLSGDVGIGMGTGNNEIRVYDTDLRFTGIDTRTLEQMMPSLEVPRRGTFTGRATLAGTMRSMRVDGDVAFADQRDGTSRLVANGTVGVVEHGFRADELHLRAAPLQLALVRAVRPTFPLVGTITGTATVNGSTLGRLAATADLTVHDRGAVTRVAGQGAATLRGQRQVDATLDLAPLSLAMAGRFAPALELHGDASGHVRVAGAFEDVGVAADLRLPEGGVLVTRARANIAGAEPAYDVRMALQVVNLASVSGRMPPTSITATASARGLGTKPATMSTAVAADLVQSTLDSVGVDTARVRLAVANGLLTVDTFAVHAPFGNATLAGSFGLVAGREGTLRYEVAIDSLGKLARFVASASDTGRVPPRPARNAVALARARADSARVAQATEMAQLVTGSPPPKLVVDTARALPLDSVAGAVLAAGTVRGSLARFDLRGRLGVDSIVARGNRVRRGKAEYVWLGARTPGAAMIVGADLDSVEAGGFALDSVQLRATYTKPHGHVQLAVLQDTSHLYTATADLSLLPQYSELLFRDLALRFDTLTWQAVRPGAVRWGPNGIRVVGLDLRAPGNGRIYVNGLLPMKGPLDLELDVTNLQIGNLVDLAQTDVKATGWLSMNARLTGTREAPRLQGAIGVAAANYRGTPLPDLRADFQYADTRLAAHALVLRANGQQLAVARAQLPVNLALAGYSGPRVLEAPLRVDLEADSLPLDALPRFTDAVADLKGRVIGFVQVRGTPKHPVPVGRLALDFASMRMVALGITVHDISGGVRMLGDTVVIDSLVGHSGGGRFTANGVVGIANVQDPTFALAFLSRNALLMDNEQGRIFADANIGVSGSMTQPRVAGNTTIRSGVIYIPEPDHREVLSEYDPAVFGVVDTAVVAQQNLLEQTNPIMRKLRVDAAVTIDRDTWVRSAEANVEIYSTNDLAVHVNRETRTLTAAGIVNTDRGQYSFMGRRFTISQGSVIFVGDPQLNPNLQITALRTVQLAGQQALNIQIIIGGTLLNPKLSLASDAQPPMSQSDLLSYLAFGENTSSLLQFNGSALSGAGAAGGGGLVGNAAALASRQLASLALGVLANEFEASASRSLGTDVFDVTPANVPAEVASLSSLQTVLLGTEIEAGKYVDPDTYVAVQVRPTLVAPGLYVVHRMPKGYRVEFSLEPRVLLQQPSLSQLQDVQRTSVFGTFLIRQWRF